MALYLTGSNLITSGGSLGAHANCCCPACVCNNHKPDPGACKCGTIDYQATGTYSNFGAVSVTVTGTVSPLPTTFGCATPASCASPNGTFVTACESTNRWFIASYVCSHSGVDFYYVTRVSVSYTFELVVTVNISSGQFAETAGSPNPYPTMTLDNGGGAPNPGNPRTWNATGWARSAFNDWQYEPSASCRAECNTVITRNYGCPSGSAPSLVLLNASTRTTDGCNVNGLSVAVSI